MCEKQRKDRTWTQRYGSFEPDEIKQFFNEIKYNFTQPKDTNLKKLNKLLIWINFLHTQSSLGEFCKQWHVSEQTIKNYLLDVTLTILLTYKNDQSIIGLPTKIISSNIVKKLVKVFEQSV